MVRQARPFLAIMAAFSAFSAGGASARVPGCPASAIARANARFVRDMRDKDFADVIVRYAPGAMFVQPSGARVAQGPALENLYRQVFATFDSALVLHVRRITATRAGLCIESGRFEERLRDRKSGRVSRVHGGFRFVLSAADWRFTEMAWFGGGHDRRRR